MPKSFCEISGFRRGVYEDDSLVDIPQCSVVRTGRPDDGGNR
jgi:hypothetical protein